MEGFELGRVEVDEKCREIVAKGFQVGCYRLDYLSSGTGADRSAVPLLIYLVQYKYSRSARVSGNAIPAAFKCLRLFFVDEAHPSAASFFTARNARFSTICLSLTVEACNIANY